MAATPWKQRVPIISKLARSRPEPLGRIVIFGSGVFYGGAARKLRAETSAKIAKRGQNGIPPDKKYPLQLTCSAAHWGVCVYKDALYYEVLDSMAIEIEHRCKKELRGQIMRFHGGAEGASASSAIFEIYAYFGYKRDRKTTITVTHVFALMARTGVEVQFKEDPHSLSFAWRTAYGLAKLCAEHRWSAINVEEIVLERTCGRMICSGNVSGACSIWPGAGAKRHNKNPLDPLVEKSNCPRQGQKGGIKTLHPRSMLVKQDSDSSSSNSSVEGELQLSPKKKKTLKEAKSIGFGIASIWTLQILQAKCLISEKFVLEILNNSWWFHW